MNNTTEDVEYDEVWGEKNGKLCLISRKKRKKQKKQMKSSSSFITMEHVNQIMQKNLKAKKDCSVVKFKPQNHNVFDLPGCWIFLDDGWTYYYMFGKRDVILCKRIRWYHKVSKKVLEDFKIDFNFSVFDATLAKA